MDNIADQIKRARKAAGLTQAQLAELVGSTQGRIADWENERRRMTIDTLEQLAAALGTTFEIGADIIKNETMSKIDASGPARCWGKREGSQYKCDFKPVETFDPRYEECGPKLLDDGSWTYTCPYCGATYVGETVNVDWKILSDGNEERRRELAKLLRDE